MPEMLGTTVFRWFMFSGLGLTWCKVRAPDDADDTTLSCQQRQRTTWQENEWSDRQLRTSTVASLEKTAALTFALISSGRSRLITCASSSSSHLWLCGTEREREGTKFRLDWPTSNVGCQTFFIKTKSLACTGNASLKASISLSCKIRLIDPWVCLHGGLG